MKRQKNPGAELLVMGINPHKKKENPLRMVNSNFTLPEKMALGRLGIRWTEINTPAKVRDARKALRAMEKARAQFGGGRATRKNPEAGTARDAQVVYSGFHATEAEYVDTTNEAHIPPGDYAELGRLVNIGFKPTSAADVKYRQVLVSERENVRVLSSPNRKQLYFAGDQDVSEVELRKLGCGNAEECELGEAMQIVYIAKKYHPEVPENARGEIVEWQHDFGEEDGIRPRLFFNRKTRRLFLRGGNYKIENAGIVN